MLVDCWTTETQKGCSATCSPAEAERSWKQLTTLATPQLTLPPSAFLAQWSLLSDAVNKQLHQDFLQDPHNIQISALSKLDRCLSCFCDHAWSRWTKFGQTGQVVQRKWTKTIGRYAQEHRIQVYLAQTWWLSYPDCRIIVHRVCKTLLYSVHSYLFTPSIDKMVQEILSPYQLKLKTKLTFMKHSHNLYLPHVQYYLPNKNMISCAPTSNTNWKHQVEQLMEV